MFLNLSCVHLDSDCNLSVSTVVVCMDLGQCSLISRYLTFIQTEKSSDKAFMFLSRVFLLQVVSESTQHQQDIM